jgi:hypothetical protein
MNIALRHPVRYARALAPLVLPAIREIVRPSVEIAPIPSPELIAFMQKIQFCSMGLMTGFGDHNHCHLLPAEQITAGSPMVVCFRHIDEALRLGAVDELILS